MSMDAELQVVVFHGSPTAPKPHADNGCKMCLVAGCGPLCPTEGAMAFGEISHPEDDSSDREAHSWWLRC